MKFDGDIDAPFSHLLRLAEDELLATLTALPAEIREALEAVPVILEEFPSPEALDDGIASDQLGVFEGGTTADSGIPQPPRIVLSRQPLGYVRSRRSRLPRRSPRDPAP